MGNARPRLTGHLLCTVPFPEPTTQIEALRRRFPDLKITYITTAADPLQKDQGLSDDIWKDATYLATLSALPEPEKAPKLKLVHLISAGTNHLQSDALYTRTHIPITTSSGIHGPTIAEWVLMTLLVVTHKFRLMDGWQSAGTWGPSNSHALGPSSPLRFVQDLAGQRLGVLGYGSIGRQVGRLAQALGMSVYAFTASPRATPESKRDGGYIVPGTGDPDGSIPERWFHGLHKEALHAFLGQDLDVLVVCVPLTEQTAGLLGESEFRLLERRNAFFVNISRGGIVCQEQLVEALWRFERDDGNHGLPKMPGCGRKGLRGAALDVADPEPLPAHHELFSAPNCVVTPHVSGSNVDYAKRTFDLLRMNLERVEDGGKLVNEVDRERGY